VFSIALMLIKLQIAGYGVLPTEAETEPNFDFEIQPLTSNSIEILRVNDSFVCSLCDKVFRSRRSCRSHTHVHLGNTTCNLCKKTFCYRHDLIRHFKANHFKEH